MLEDVLDLGERWLILRTAGPRTLGLAASLAEVGVETWTPRRTYRRPVPGAKPRLDGVRPTQDVDGAILPTFVFARAAHFAQLEEIERDQANPRVASPHPPFALWRYCGAVPLIAEGEIEGLREAESEEAALRQKMLDAENAEAAQALRNEAIRNERARRRAEQKLERERRDRLAGERSIKLGDSVEVEQHHGFAGLTGTVESMVGTTAHVSFGGVYSIIVDAWRLAPIVLH